MLGKRKEIVEFIESKNYQSALKEMDEKYGRVYNVLNKSVKYQYRFPFSLKKKYRIEAELCPKKKAVLLLDELAEERLKGLEEDRMIGLVKEVKEEHKKLVEEKKKLVDIDESKEFNDLRSLLVKKGVSKGLSNDIVDEIRYITKRKNESNQDLINDLIKNKHQGEKLAWTEGPAAFMGPTGVGKTTTIVKMVNKSNDKKRVEVVTKDNVRMGAYAELKLYSEKYGFDITCNELEDELIRLENKDKYFIDMPGLNPKNPKRIESIKKYSDDNEVNYRFVVVSSTQRTNDMIKTIQLYKKACPTNIIVTKMDETSEPGFILDLLNEIEIPIAYITNGQNVTAYLQEFNLDEYLDYFWKFE